MKGIAQNQPLRNFESEVDEYQIVNRQQLMLLSFLIPNRYMSHTTCDIEFIARNIDFFDAISMDGKQYLNEIICP